LGFTRFLREKLIQLTGYWTYNKKMLPVGADLVTDLKEKIAIDLKTIFDVGANIGQTATVFSRNFPKATIHSFEPVSTTFQKLHANTRENKRINCHQLALSDVEEEIEMKIFEGHLSVMNSLKRHLQNDSENSKIETIRTITLDHFLAVRAIPSIDLLKIDAEGYEIPVLNGAVHTLRNNQIKLIYLEVGFSKKNVRHSYFFEVFNFLTEYDFAFFGLYEIHHYDFKNENHYGNALFIHKNYLKNNSHY
jgi:FkbM family methyltransferase